MQKNKKSTSAEKEIQAENLFYYKEPGMLLITFESVGQRPPRSIGRNGGYWTHGVTAQIGKEATRITGINSYGDAEVGYIELPNNVFEKLCMMELLRRGYTVIPPSSFTPDEMGV